jgi:hypothetical protein
MRAGVQLFTQEDDQIGPSTAVSAHYIQFG